jgi:hypothetical protein
MWGPREALLVFLGGGGGESCLYEGILILNEIWAQDKLYILEGTFLGLNILLIA